MAKTLLLADDSVTIQKVVSISFASEDVTLVTVDNGDDAVDRAKETRPDLIMADVVMPGKSGYEVCEAIKADPELRHIPVLLLSGTFEAFDEERAARAGAAGHVAKPFEAQSLVDQVNRLLAGTPPPPPVEASPAMSAEPMAAPVEASPAAPPETVAAPAETNQADSFDFFDDDLAELDSAVPEVTDEAPNLEMSDSAFGLADDDFTPMEAAPAPEADAGFGGGGEAFPDRTLAIMPDEDESSDAVGIPPTAVSDPMDSSAPVIGDGELVATVEEEDDSFMTVDPASTADEAFDFSFESESTAPESIGVEDVAVAALDAEVDELVAGTVVDPLGAEGFDVDPMALVGDFADSEDPVGGAPMEQAPVATEIPDATRVVDAAADYAELIAPVELEMSPEPLVPDAELPEPAPVSSPLPEPTDSAAMHGDDSAARAEAMLAEISPDLREALHDTLEKITWEAFGDVTETIVREVVDRVEKVAWEVVPQLAETLIKAEIQRLKNDRDD